MRILIDVKIAGINKCSAAMDARIQRAKSIDLLGMENSTPFSNRLQRKITKKKKKSEMRMNVEMSDQHFNRNISNLQPKIAKYI